MTEPSTREQILENNETFFEKCREYFADKWVEKVMIFILSIIGAGVLGLILKAAHIV